MNKDFNSGLNSSLIDSRAGTMGTEILPAQAMPNLLRGISQFKKSGALWYDLCSVDKKFKNDPRKNLIGYLSFADGLVTGLGTPACYFAELLLGRLNRAGYLPPSVFQLLLESRLQIDGLIKILETESYLSSTRLHDVYQAMIEDHVFEVLGSENGSIKFTSQHAGGFERIDSQVTEFISFIPGGKDDMGRGFFGSCQSLSPCQIMLDYLEVDKLHRDIAEGEVFILATASVAQRSLLSENEQKILQCSEVDISLSSLISSLADSKRVILELVSKLNSEGALSLDTKCSLSVGEGDRSAEAKSSLNEEKVDCFDTAVEAISAEDINTGLFERLNSFLLAPEGIEWILWRLLIPFVLIAFIFGMSGLQSFVGDLRLFISH